MTPNELRARCKEVVELANKLYGIDLSQVQIGWCKGRAAGRAGGKRLRDTVMSNYYVQFNHDMLGRDAAEHVDSNTVPHEYAHVLGYINPDRFGRKHDYLWAKTCKELGGNGVRCHQEEVVFGTGTTYEYTTTTGKKVRISSQKHGRVVRGVPLVYRDRSMGRIDSTCAYSIVGHQGRSLATPIVKKAVADLPPNHPAVIESFVRTPWTPEAIKNAVVTATLFEKGVAVKQWTPSAVRAVVQAAPKTVAPMNQQGLSKAAMARAVMLSGHNGGKSYEEIILAIMAATGHDRQLSRSYYKGNYQKVGVPAPI